MDNAEWTPGSDIEPDTLPDWLFDEEGALIEDRSARALICLRALADAPDPAAELARLRAVEAAAQRLLDNAYEERERCVALIAALSLACGWEAGMARTAIEGWDEEWHGLTLIDLPTGQVSWHMHDSHAAFFEGLPQYSGVWDGHDTEEKYRRVDELAKRIFAAHTATAGEVEG